SVCLAEIHPPTLLGRCNGVFSPPVGALIKCVEYVGYNVLPIIVFVLFSIGVSSVDKRINLTLPLRGEGVNRRYSGINSYRAMHHPIGVNFAKRVAYGEPRSL